jgi:phosphoribosylanthranilate isomerase
MVPRVKICCIADPEEADMAIRAGAWALGLVAEMPSGVGPISDGEIAAIAKMVPEGIETFLLTSRTNADAIIDHHQFCQTTTIQLVDHVPFEDLKKIRAALPGINIVQVIHVLGEESVEQALEVSPLVDMILLDSGKPDAAVRTLGGTGDTHNWDISLKIRQQITIPMFLAGGLHPGNIVEAINHVRPFGVDLCSRIRSDGRLDQTKLDGFFAGVRDAGKDLAH